MRGFASLKAFFALRHTNPYLFLAQVGEWAINVVRGLFFFLLLLISPYFSEKHSYAMYYIVLTILPSLSLNNIEQRFQY
jgi:hypothetical protein